MQSHQLQSSMVGNAVPIKSVELSTFINNCHEFKHFIAQYIAPHWRQLALIAGCIPPSPAPRETDLDCAYWLLSMFFRWKLTLGSFVDAINQIPELFTFTRHLERAIRWHDDIGVPMLMNNATSTSIAASALNFATSDTTSVGR